MIIKKSRKRNYLKKNKFQNNNLKYSIKKQKGGDRQLSELINQYEKQFSPKINHQKDNNSKSQKNNNKDKNISPSKTNMDQSDYEHLEHSLSQDQLSKTDIGDSSTELDSEDILEQSIKPKQDSLSSKDISPISIKTSPKLSSSSKSTKKKSSSKLLSSNSTVDTDNGEKSIDSILEKFSDQTIDFDKESLSNSEVKSKKILKSSMPNQKRRFIEQFLGKSKKTNKNIIKPPTFFDKQVGEYIRSQVKNTLSSGIDLNKETTDSQQDQDIEGDKEIISVKSSSTDLIEIEDITDDNIDNSDFCNLANNSNNLNKFLENAKKEYLGCIDNDDMLDNRCKLIFDQKITEYNQLKSQSKKGSNELMVWPGIPDTEPNLTYNLKFYHLVNDYFSGVNSNCNLTVPSYDKISTHNCQRGGSKFTNMNKTKSQTGGKVNFFRHQLLVSKYLSPETPYRGILAYHGIGSGKTLLSVSVLSNFIKYDPDRVICFICPPSLIANFYKDLDKIEAHTLLGFPIAREIQQYGQKIAHELKSQNMDHNEILTQIKEKQQKRKEREIRKRVVVMSYESWGNRLRGRTSWDTAVNTEDIVNSKKNKGGFSGIISTDKNKVSQMDTATTPLFDNTLVIMDEVQELVACKDKKVIPHMNWIQQAVRNANDIRILFMTATPMKNHPFELGVLFNLLKPKQSRTKFPEILVPDLKMDGLQIVDETKTKEAFENQFIIKKDHNQLEIQNEGTFRHNIVGLVSYYSVDKDITQFASKIDLEPVMVDMSDSQYNVWRKSRNAEIGNLTLKKVPSSCNDPSSKKCKSSKQVSLNQNLSKEKINNSVNKDKLSIDSNKIYIASRNIDKFSVESKQFIYSEFNMSGVYALRVALRKMGWIEYGFKKYDNQPNWVSISSLFTNESYSRNKLKALNDEKWVEKADMTSEQRLKETVTGGGIWANKEIPLPERKAFITLGDDSDAKYKEGIIKGLFNRSLNIKGNTINAIIVNSKYSEGISLFGVRKVHILETPTSLSLREQIIGRAVRSCSHKGLKFPDEWNVTIYQYVSTYKTLGFYRSERYKHLDNLSVKEEDSLNSQKLVSSGSQTGDSSVNEELNQLGSGGKKKNEQFINICLQFTDRQNCNLQEYCQWNDSVNPITTSTITSASSISDKCLELPTDFIIEKLNDRTDFLKQKFLTLVKEGAVDCRVNKNANESYLKCYDPIEYQNNLKKNINKDNITDLPLKDQLSLDQQRCLVMDENQCRIDDQCAWFPDEDSGKCKFITNESLDCPTYKDQGNCLKNKMCLWDQNKGKCFTYNIEDFKKVNHGIYFLNVTGKPVVYEIIDKTEEYISQNINKLVNLIEENKEDTRIIKNLNLIMEIFKEYPILISRYKSKIITILTEIKSNYSEVFTKLLESKYSLFLEEIIKIDGHVLEDPFKVFKDDSKTLEDQVNYYNTIKKEKEIQMVRKHYMISSLSSDSESLNLRNYKLKGKETLDFILKIKISNSFLSNSKDQGLDYLIVSSNIPELSINLENIENISRMTKEFEYLGVDLKLIFTVNYGKLDQLDLIYYSKNKDMSIPYSFDLSKTKVKTSINLREEV